MAEIIDVLKIRQKLGRKEWNIPYEFMSNQWVFDTRANIIDAKRIIVSTAPWLTPGSGETDWIHASISREHSLPSYNDLKLMHKAVFNDGWAYQIFAPESRHINIHPNALHLFGRVDGMPQLPDFQMLSGINSI